MFQRFTERARQVVVFAQDEARRLGHNHIGTEHILLGLLRMKEGVAARVFTDLGISAEEAKAQVDRIVGRGGEVPAGQIPFTPRAKKMLELALREALSLGHNYIGVEHVLLSLGRIPDGAATRALSDLGVNHRRLRESVFRSMGWPPVSDAIDIESSQRDFGFAITPLRTLALGIGLGILTGWLIWGL